MAYLEKLSDPLVKTLVWEIKYRGNKSLSEKLGTIMYDVIVEELSERNVFTKGKSVLLIPMPVSNKRRFERGWNQAELLAEAIKLQDHGNQLKYLPRELSKVRHTESQTKANTRHARLENLHGSMKVFNPSSVSGKVVVLIDDVTTTGATFAEAKRALAEARALKIFCFALSH